MNGLLHRQAIRHSTGPGVSFSAGVASGSMLIAIPTQPCICLRKTSISPSLRMVSRSPCRQPEHTLRFTDPDSRTDTHAGNGNGRKRSEHGWLWGRAVCRRRTERLTCACILEGIASLRVTRPVDVVNHCCMDLLSTNRSVRTDVASTAKD